MIHMRLLGEFKRPWNDAQEIKLIQSDDATKVWHPTTKDFEAVAKVDGGSSPHTYTIKNVREMLSRIISVPDESILILSIITHATRGLIGLSGSVSLTGQVMIAGGDGPYLNAGGIDQYIVDRGGVLNDWSSGKKDTEGRKLRDLARKKFHSNAVIIVYGCNSGKTALDNLLLRCLARTFNVTVFGFGKYIKYHPFYAGGAIISRTKTALASGPFDDVTALAKPGVGHLQPDIPFVQKPTPEKLFE